MLATNSIFSQSDTFRFVRLSRIRLSFVVSYYPLLQSSERTYTDKSHVKTNLLVYSGLSSNFLERTLRLNAPEHSIAIEIAKLEQKHITSLLSGEKRKRQKINQANRDIILCDKKLSLHGDAIINS